MTKFYRWLATQHPLAQAALPVGLLIVGARLGHFGG
jgi:hypothetical protein